MNKLDRSPNIYETGYSFFNSEREEVGGAASTIHHKPMAQKKANELGEPVDVYLASGNRWHYIGKFTNE